jgi:multidrug transporter EmrE-like cation transporter
MSDAVPEPERPVSSAPERAWQPTRSLGPLAWALHPYAQLAVGSVLVTASELLMKKGAVTTPAGHVGWFGVAALASGWTWAGIVTYVLSFASWIYVLRFVPLGIAYALINVVHVLIPLGAWALLGEAVSGRRWAGIGLVVAGLLLILRPVVRAEEKL